MAFDQVALVQLLIAALAWLPRPGSLAIFLSSFFDRRCIYYLCIKNIFLMEFDVNPLLRNGNR